MPLIQYIGEKLTVDYCRTMDLGSLFTIIQSFSSNCYVPEPIENRNLWTNDILPTILQNEQLASTHTNNPHWLHFTLHLLTLNHFDEKMITRVLSREYLTAYLNQSKTQGLDLSRILIIYQTAAMNTNISLDSVDKRYIGELLQNYESRSVCWIQKSLIEALGCDYIVRNVSTKYSHWIPTLLKINTSTWTLEKVPANLARDALGFVQLDDIKCEKNEKL